MTQLGLSVSPACAHTQFMQAGAVISTAPRARTPLIYTQMHFAIAKSSDLVRRVDTDLPQQGATAHSGTVHAGPHCAVLVQQPEAAGAISLLG